MRLSQNNNAYHIYLSSSYNQLYFAFLFHKGFILQVRIQCVILSCSSISSFFIGKSKNEGFVSECSVLRKKERKKKKKNTKETKNRSLGDSLKRNQFLLSTVIKMNYIQCYSKKEKKLNICMSKTIVCNFQILSRRHYYLRFVATVIVTTPCIIQTKHQFHQSVSPLLSTMQTQASTAESKCIN